MNEKKIQALAEQTNLGPCCESQAVAIKKFAELIVRECVSLFDGTREMKTVGVLTHNQVVGQIKQHFGVE